MKSINYLLNPARLFALAILSLLVGTAAGQQASYVPVQVTGYNADVIANGQGPAARSTTHTVDRGDTRERWCFADSTFRTPAGLRPTRALPPSGFFRSRTTQGLTYQMGSSSGNNSLRIDGAASGTLTLVSPQTCNELMVLATEGNGSSAPKTFTVTFTDGTQQVFRNTRVPDWFGGGTTPAIVVGSRINVVNDAIDNRTNDPSIYEVRLSLDAANYGKRVQSLGVSKTSIDPVLNVMGISLGSRCQGLPQAGTAQASPASVCPSAATTLSLSGANTGGGLTYQWQASTDGGFTINDIPGATGATYVARPLVTTQYRARVLCLTQAATSLPVTVVVTPVTFAYQCPPFYHNGPAATPDLAAAAGQFTAPTGLAIDAATGVVDLKASAVGRYTITYTPSGGCARTASFEVLDGLQYPNIITPNQDGYNDAFRLPSALAPVSNYHLQIFNRWGRCVYTSTDATQGWAAPGCAAGLYYYLLEYTTCAGSQERYRSWLEVAL